MIKPKIEELLPKADSKFALAIAVAKRARQIVDFLNAIGRGELAEGQVLPPPVTDAVTKKPFIIALEEIAQGKIEVRYASEKDAEREELLQDKTEAKVKVEKKGEKQKEKEEEKKKAEKKSKKKK